MPAAGEGGDGQELCRWVRFGGTVILTVMLALTALKHSITDFLFVF